MRRMSNDATRTGTIQSDASPNEAALKVTGLTKRYGQRTVVSSLDFIVRRGEVFGFLGPNGAGKTTTISMILGLITADSGHIEMLGHHLTAGDRAGLRQIGAIVESPAHYPYLSARDNLRILAGARGGVAAHRIDEVLTLVGLQARQHNRVGTFSLGMKQRLGLAGALLHTPALLILDEPSNGLDPAGIVEMRGLILRLARAGQTIILCSHLLAEVQQVCDRVMILADGRSIVQGDVATLLRQGTHTVLRLDDPPRAEALLAQLPWIERVTRDGDTLLLVLPDDHVAMLGRFLAEQGLVVFEMRRQAYDLEQLFLSITADATTR
jgi:ABC-2 type transport system ATP-binding protein